MSGYQTPREIKEEQWRTLSEATKPGKLEMREMYKELGGRKAKSKMKVGSSGIRDRGGWVANGEWDIWPGLHGGDRLFLFVSDVRNLLS